MSFINYISSAAVPLTILLIIMYGLVEKNKVLVTVGEVTHPMQEEHYIEWISIQTKFGNQRKVLKASDKPEVCFALCEEDEVEALYAYCNLHGLWKA